MSSSNASVRAWKYAAAAKAILAGPTIGVSSWDDPPPPADQSMASLRDQLRILVGKARDAWNQATSPEGKALAARALKHIRDSASAALEVVSDAMRGDFDAIKRLTVMSGVDGMLAWALLGYVLMREMR